MTMSVGVALTIYGLGFLVGAFYSGCLFYAVGYNSGIDAAREKIIKAYAGGWEIDPETGEKSFKITSDTHTGVEL